MRNKTKMCFTIDIEVAYELREHGNRSQLVNMAIRDYIRTLDSNRKMLDRLTAKHLGNVELSPEEEERERIKKEEQEKKLAEIHRKRQEEEAKRIKQKEEEKIFQIQSAPDREAWTKHYRIVRTDPEHNYNGDCWWCNYFPDLKNYWKDR